MKRVTPAQLMMLLIAGLFIAAENSLQAAAPSPDNLFINALEGAIDDKLHEAGQDDKAGNEVVFDLDEIDSEYDDIDEEENVRWYLNTQPLQDLAGLAKAYFMGIDWTGHYAQVRTKFITLGQEGINGMYARIRGCYWGSKAILPEEREFSNVFVFGRDDQQLDTVTCTTIDGYNFVIPTRIIGDGFLNATICNDFKEHAQGLKNVQVNLNSRVMYLLCTAKRLQIAHSINAQATAADVTLEAVAMRLKNQDLFDAIKACAYLNITDADILVPLHYVVAAVLQTRHPVRMVMDLINKELKLYKQTRQQLVDALKNVIAGFLSTQELLPAEEPLANKLVNKKSVKIGSRPEDKITHYFVKKA